MTFPLKLALGLTMLAFPLVELALLIKVGGMIGFWPLLGIMALTAVAGSFVIRMTGISAVSRLASQVEAGGSPVKSLLDEFLRFTAGVLLILPGLLGDCLGLVLLVPAVRTLVLQSFGALFKSIAVTGGGIWRAPARQGGQAADRGPSATRVTIIEGEYERVEDDGPPANSKTRH